MVLFTIEILQLLYMDKVIDVGCAGPANSSGSVVEEIAELPQLQLIELWTWSFTRPLCATTDAVVDVLTQFIDGCGRRCGAAATNSSCRS